LLPGPAGPAWKRILRPRTPTRSRSTSTRSRRARSPLGGGPTSAARLGRPPAPDPFATPRPPPRRTTRRGPGRERIGNGPVPRIRWAPPCTERPPVGARPTGFPDAPPPELAVVEPGDGPHRGGGRRVV